MSYATLPASKAYADCQPRHPKFILGSHIMRECVNVMTELATVLRRLWMYFYYSISQIPSFPLKRLHLNMNLAA